jgi:hypothetical protein
VKNRIPIRCAAAAASVAVALTGLTALTVGMTAWGTEAPERTVTRTGELPPEASVSRSDEPVGERTSREARRERNQRHERASRSRTYGGDPRAIAASIAARQYGWGADQFSCLDTLWTRESGWDVHAENPSSGAYGIPQALPGSKMAAYGSDWADNPTTQIQWGLAYIRDSYGTPCGAWSELRSEGWY